MTVQQLALYDGRDENKPLLIGIKGTIYDVSSRSDIYGKGCGYNVLCGKDASLALAKMSFDATLFNKSIQDITEKERKSLDSWVSWFQNKYIEFGKLM